MVRPKRLSKVMHFARHTLINIIMNKGHLFVRINSNYSLGERCNVRVVEIQFYSLPHFDHSVPATGKHQRRFDGVPHTANRRALAVSAVLLQYLVLLPVPKEQIAVTVTAHQKLAVGTKRHFAGVTRHDVAGEFLFPLHRVLVPRLKDHNRIVQTLAAKEALGRMHDQSRHGLHRRVTNVLDRHANAPFPDQNLLVVTARDHFGAAVFHKENRIHRAQMMIVFLRYLARFGAVRDNFLVTAARDEKVIVAGIELDTIGQFAVGKRLDHPARFGIPQPQVTAQ
jgi:hypothetical protein